MRNKSKLQKLSPDILAKEFWRSNERFADLFNALVYKKKLINPGELQELDTDVSSLVIDANILETIRRIRDLSKISCTGVCYRILAIENQQDIHYGMTIKCLLYDALAYCQQVKRLAKKNRQEERLRNPAEYLSGIKKTDRLIPCRTIVIYYGEKEWDGAQNLSELMEFACAEDKEAFNDYHLELICLNQLNVMDYNFENKDVRDFLLLVSSLYQNAGKELSEQLCEVDIDVAYTAITVTGTTGLYDRIVKETMAQGKERINMCEAVRRALEEEHAEGRIEGVLAGKLEGKTEIAIKMLMAGKPLVEIQEFTDLTEEDIMALKRAN